MSSTTSFAFKVKEELAKIERSEVAKRSVLAGFLKSQGHVRLSSNETLISMSSEIASIAKMLYSYIKDLYEVTPFFSYKLSQGFKKKVHYEVNLAVKDRSILDDLRMDLFSSAIPNDLVKTKEQATAYISGVFLACGSVNSPSSSNYHLEMALENETFAINVSKLMNHKLPMSFNSRVTTRRMQSVVYIKKGESIADFLALLGASSSTLEFEDARVLRDMANIENRLDNLDGANMAKTLKTGQRQIEEIEYFIHHGGLSQFQNEKLEKLLILRLSHEDSSLEELARLLSEELNTEISKSNVNHLFRFLHERYIKEKEGDKYV